LFFSGAQFHGEKISSIHSRAAEKQTENLIGRIVL
jgi:hypothetical protein